MAWAVPHSIRNPLLGLGDELDRAVHGADQARQRLDVDQRFETGALVLDGRLRADAHRAVETLGVQGPFADSQLHHFVDGRAPAARAAGGVQEAVEGGGRNCCLDRWVGH